MVVQFRLNTEDIMGCIDVLNLSDINKDGMSMAMVCRLVLSSFLQGAREKGMIPKREGYEYTDMVAQFSKASHGKKVALTNNLFAVEAKNQMSDMPNQHINISQHSQHQAHSQQQYNSPDDLLIKKKGRLLRVILELEERRDIDELNFTPEQHDKLVALHAALVQLNNDVDVDIRTLLD